MDLTDVIEQALAINRDTLEEGGIAIVREYAALPATMSDRHQLLQIMVNLINNAIHVMNAVPGQASSLDGDDRLPPRKPRRGCRSRYVILASASNRRISNASSHKVLPPAREGKGWVFTVRVWRQHSWRGSLSAASEGEGWVYVHARFAARASGPGSLMIEEEEDHAQRFAKYRY